MENSVQTRPVLKIEGYKVNSQGMAPMDAKHPPRQSIKRVIRHLNDDELRNNLIVIARNSWLKCHKLPLPAEEGIYNLCVQIKKGQVIRAFYSETMQHLLKKLNYKLIILN